MRKIIQSVSFRPRNNLVPILTHMHCPSPIRSRLSIPPLTFNLALQRRIRHTHDRISQIVETVIVVNQLPLVQRRVTGPHLHRQHIHVRLHVIQAVHLVKYGEHVRVFSAQHGELVEMHGRRQIVVTVGGYLEEAAALWGEGVPGGFCAVE